MSQPVTSSMLESLQLQSKKRYGHVSHKDIFKQEEAGNISKLVTTIDRQNKSARKKRGKYKPRRNKAPLNFRQLIDLSSIDFYDGISIKAVRKLFNIEPKPKVELVSKPKPELPPKITWLIPPIKPPKEKKPIGRPKIKEEEPPPPIVRPPAIYDNKTPYGLATELQLKTG